MPPSVNAAYANVSGRGRVKNTAYRRYEKEFARWVMEKEISRLLPFKPKPLALYLYFYLPDWFTKKATIRIIDIANFEKVLVDCLTKALGIDDSNLFEVHLFKCVSTRPRVDVLISDSLVDAVGLLKLK